jgi:hypothetical protein
MRARDDPEFLGPDDAGETVKRMKSRMPFL